MIVLDKQTVMKCKECQAALKIIHSDDPPEQRFDCPGCGRSFILPLIPLGNDRYQTDPANVRAIRPGRTEQKSERF
jgi:transposase-like protein